MNLRSIRTYVLFSVAALMTGCAMNGLSQTPPVTQVNTQTIGKLEFAVGTANFGFDGNAIGLNVVTSFRQSGGLSAVLLNTPTITGPSGFSNSADNQNPAESPDCKKGVLHAGADAGTNKISGSPQNPNPIATPLPATFGQGGGVFGYGIEPLNSTTSSGRQSPYFGVGNLTADCDQTPDYPAYPTPFYMSPSAVATLDNNFGLKTAPVYLGGPPAYPFFKDTSYPANFAGFSQGFNAFELTPVAGSYSLNVTIPAANANTATVSASATLASVSGLASYGSAPTWTSDGRGGGSGTVTVPSDSRIVETMVYVYDENNGSYFTAGPIRGTGAQPYSIPDNLGACGTIGCQGTSPQPGMAASDTIVVYAASYDYGMFEASRPISTSQTPAITGANGQADVTFSPLLKANE
ncbi:MAG TPA: hypothetical protein VFL13_01470 [Candidatus Baltobacteraceae bacterium]|nr:hypothetical protein [Candidatus Baltobacteraceae bacterium]